MHFVPVPKLSPIFPKNVFPVPTPIFGEFQGIFPKNSPISSLSPSPIGPQYSPKMSFPSPLRFLGNFGEFSLKIPQSLVCPHPQLVPDIPQKCLPCPHPNFLGKPGNFLQNFPVR